MNKTIEQNATAESNVSRLAYQLWENAGRPSGRDLEFWLTAEAKVRANAQPAVSGSKDVVSEKSSKAPRATRNGVKKAWPKPYPSLPKF
jgi:hypothetical protein